MTNITKRQTVFVVISIMLGLFLSSLDSTIVSTAMPKIVDSLNGMSLYTWPFTAYMLAIAISTPISGKLADIFGYKKVLLVGIFVFLVGSALSGLSQDMYQLSAFRALQGLGGGVLASVTISIIGLLFAPDQRSKIMGIGMSAFAIASLIGPTLGGTITDNWGWRWVFYVNIPIGIIALLFIFFAMPNSEKNTNKKPLDILGAITFILGVVPLLLAFTWVAEPASKYTWGSWQIIGLLIFSVVLLITFLFVESGAKDAIIPLHLFQKNHYNISIILMVLSSAAMMTMMLYIPLFIQGVLGISASNSGAIMTPMMISVFIGSILVGFITSKVGGYKLFVLAGFIIMSTGFILFTTLTTSTSYSFIILCMVIAGIGLGIILPLMNTIIQNAFETDEMATATSSAQFFKLLGSTIGASIFGYFVNQNMNTNIAKVNMTGMPATLKEFFSNPTAISNTSMLNKLKAALPSQLLPVFNKLLLQVKTVLSNAIVNVFWVGLVIAIIALICTLFYKKIVVVKKDKNEVPAKV